MSTQLEYARALSEAAKEIVCLHEQIESLQNAMCEDAECLFQDRAALENSIYVLKDTIEGLKNDLKKQKELVCKKDEELRHLKNQLSLLANKQ